MAVVPGVCPSKPCKLGPDGRRPAQAVQTTLLLENTPPPP